MNITTNQASIRERLFGYMNRNPCSIRELAHRIECAQMTLKLFVEGKDMKHSKALLKIIKFLEEQKDTHEK